jgi:hypothetical protein
MLGGILAGQVVDHAEEAHAQHTLIVVGALAGLECLPGALSTHHGLVDGQLAGGVEPADEEVRQVAQVRMSHRSNSHKAITEPAVGPCSHHS